MAEMMISLLLALVLLIVRLNGLEDDPFYPSFGKASEIRHELAVLTTKHEIVSVIERSELILSTLGTLHLDDKLPSFHSYYGVALYQVQRVSEAEKVFEQAVQLFPNETNSWLNLGEVRVQTFKLTEAITALNEAFARGALSALPRLLRTKGWGANWDKFDLYTADLEKMASICLRGGECGIDSNSGFEYSDIPGEAFAMLTALSPAAQVAATPLHESERVVLDQNEFASKRTERLRVGMVSADFGVHPVSSLVRGLLQAIDRNIIELHTFSLQSKMSWWGLNISGTVERFHLLPAMNLRQAAQLIAQQRIDILIDLNGHTMHSGLPIMAHRPAPLQVSYLGLPTTTGAAFIDYYLSDSIATPPEQRGHYSEALVLSGPCYIVNDYAQLQGHVGVKRATRDTLRVNASVYAKHALANQQPLVNQLLYVEQVELLLATLSNSQKMDPQCFAVWMAVLQIMPGAAMLFMDYAAHTDYMPQIFQIAGMYGIPAHRIVSVGQSPWIDHLHTKTALDLILDTKAKNGHTTGLDGLWAGVPTVSMKYQAMTPERAAQSMAAALDSELGMAVSLKDYEDMAINVLRGIRETGRSRKYRHRQGKNLLAAWREQLASQRLTSRLFDTDLHAKSFTHLMQAIYEAEYVQQTWAIPMTKKFHVFASKQHALQKTAPTKVEQLYTQESEYFKPSEAHPVTKKAKKPYHEADKHDKESMPPIPPIVFDGRLIMLNIGGIRPTVGWLNVNFPGGSIDSKFVPDIHRAMHDLHGIPNNMVSAIYTSHTLEHVGFGDGMLEGTLREWFRVLRPGGILLVSVPDLETLAKLYIKKDLSMQDRWMVTRMIYGGQTDEHDYHHVGFDYTVLMTLLTQIGFCNVTRVQSFNLHLQDSRYGQEITDSSELVHFGHRISLNVVAKVCPESKPGVPYASFTIDASNATPFRGSEV